MAVIDIHAHVYPDKIAERASQSVGEFYHVGMYEGGSVEALLSLSLIHISTNTALADEL